MAEDTVTGEKTFTQDEVNKIVAERLKREREKYADYDELKARAADADRSKSALDKLAEQVKSLEERAAKAELAALRAEVAEAKGLTAKQARRLQGSTREELLADADELLAEWRPAAADKGGDSGGDKDSSGSDDGKPVTARATGGDSQSGTRTRPREALRSGTAVPSSGPDETDPMKLAAMVPRL